MSGKLEYGLTEAEVSDLVRDLGISKHDAEDCLLSEILTQAQGKPTIVDGRTAWIIDRNPRRITRYRISAGSRRRIIAGHAGHLELDPE